MKKSNIEKSHTLQMGGFFMKDGLLLDKNINPTDEQKAACIGVVLKVGKDNSGNGKDDRENSLKISRFLTN